MWPGCLLLLLYLRCSAAVWCDDYEDEQNDPRTRALNDEDEAQDEWENYWHPSTTHPVPSSSGATSQWQPQPEVQGVSEPSLSCSSSGPSLDFSSAASTWTPGASSSSWSTSPTTLRSWTREEVIHRMAEAWDEEICLSLQEEEAQAAGDDFLGVSCQLVRPMEDDDFGLPPIPEDLPLPSMAGTILAEATDEPIEPWWDKVRDRRCLRGAQCRRPTTSTASSSTSPPPLCPGSSLSMCNSSALGATSLGEWSSSPTASNSWMMPPSLTVGPSSSSSAMAPVQAHPAATSPSTSSSRVTSTSWHSCTAFMNLSQGSPSASSSTGLLPTPPSGSTMSLSADPYSLDSTYEAYTAEDTPSPWMPTEWPWPEPRSDSEVQANVPSPPPLDPNEGITQRWGVTRPGVDRWHHRNGTIRRRLEEKRERESSDDAVPPQSADSPLVPSANPERDESTATPATSFYGRQYSSWVSPNQTCPEKDDCTTTGGESYLADSEEGWASSSSSTTSEVGFYRYGVWHQRPRTASELRSHLGGGGAQRSRRRAERMAAYLAGNWKPAWLVAYIREREARQQQQTSATSTPLQHEDKPGLPQDDATQQVRPGEEDQPPQTTAQDAGDDQPKAAPTNAQLDDDDAASHLLQMNSSEWGDGWDWDSWWRSSSWSGWYSWSPRGWNRQWGTTSTSTTTVNGTSSLGWISFSDPASSVEMFGGVMATDFYTHVEPGTMLSNVTLAESLLAVVPLAQNLAPLATAVGWMASGWLSALSFSPWGRSAWEGNMPWTSSTTTTSTSLDMHETLPNAGLFPMVHSIDRETFGRMALTNGEQATLLEYGVSRTIVSRVDEMLQAFDRHEQQGTGPESRWALERLVQRAGEAADANQAILQVLRRRLVVRGLLPITRVPRNEQQRWTLFTWVRQYIPLFQDNMEQHLRTPLQPQETNRSSSSEEPAPRQSRTRSRSRTPPSSSRSIAGDSAHSHSSGYMSIHSDWAVNSDGEVIEVPDAEPGVPQNGPPPPTPTDWRLASPELQGIWREPEPEPAQEGDSVASASSPVSGPLGMGGSSTTSTTAALVLQAVGTPCTAGNNLTNVHDLLESPRTGQQVLQLGLGIAGQDIDMEQPQDGGDEDQVVLLQDRTTSWTASTWLGMTTSTSTKWVCRGCLPPSLSTTSTTSVVTTSNGAVRDVVHHQLVSMGKAERDGHQHGWFGASVALGGPLLIAQGPSVDPDDHDDPAVGDLGAADGPFCAECALRGDAGGDPDVTFPCSCNPVP